MSKLIRSTLFLALLGAACLSPMALAQQHDMAAMMDADGNGSISAAEHASAAAAMFAKADADHDGNLTRTEMQAMHAGMEGHGMGHVFDRGEEPDLSDPKMPHRLVERASTAPPPL